QRAGSSLLPAWTARLWWNDTAVDSRVEDTGFGALYLNGPTGLSQSKGSDPKLTKDVLVKKTGCPGQSDEDNWQPLGTWTGTTAAAPTCTPGSEDWAEDAKDSQPPTFAGGTIDTDFLVPPPGYIAGGIYVQATTGTAPSFPEPISCGPGSIGSRSG